METVGDLIEKGFIRVVLGGPLWPIGPKRTTLLALILFYMLALQTYYADRQCLQSESVPHGLY